MMICDLDRPRLVAGCTIFEDGERLIVRSVRGAFAIEPVHRSAMERVLKKLDGYHDFETLLGGEAPADAFYALRILDWFAQSGLLTDGYAALNGKFDSIQIIRAAGSDIAALRHANRVALQDGHAWLPILPFGDAVVVGPLIHPGLTPCFRCFELRWLGMSPALELEQAYWRSVHAKNFQTSASVERIISSSIAWLISTNKPGHSSDAMMVFHDSGHVMSMPVERHPFCDACAVTVDSCICKTCLNDWFQPAKPLAVTAHDIERLVEGRCGLAALAPSPPQSSNLPYIAVARFALPDPEMPGATQDNWCHGTAMQRREAEAVAVIEAIERYAGLAAPIIAMNAPYMAVQDRALRPSDLTLFSSAQYAQAGFAFRRFEPEQLLDWSHAYNISQNAAILVPAAAIWYGHDDALLSETSSGVAAHSSRGDALLNGALELIERDAFMIHWLNRLSPPLVDPGQIKTNSITEKLAAYVQAQGYTLKICDITTDLAIPVRLVLGIREDCQGPALVAGAGASLNADRALDRAMRELYAAISSQTPLWTLPTVMTPENVSALGDHHVAYQHPDWLPHAAFLWASEQQGKRAADICVEDNLQELVNQLSQKGFDLIGADLTPPDVRRYGLYVVRAIIPGLQPLGFGRRLRLGGERLYEAPVKMGYREAPLREGGLYSVPHCFP